MTALYLLILLHGAAFGIEKYQPKLADPMLEEWRYAYFPELDGKGIRSIASVNSSSVYWFGLDSGVVSYDGYNWQYYNEKDGLSGTPVQHMFVDRDEKCTCCYFHGNISTSKRAMGSID